MNSKNYKENGYGHNLDLLIISHSLHVSYPIRSGCLGISVRLRPAYLNVIYCLS